MDEGDGEDGGFLTPMDRMEGMEFMAWMKGIDGILDSGDVDSGVGAPLAYGVNIG